MPYDIKCSIKCMLKVDNILKNLKRVHHALRPPLLHVNSAFYKEKINKKYAIRCVGFNPLYIVKCNVLLST